ncbi:MAG: TIGR04084 family radical SAM/SPASM domain-containing protein [Candidatus Nanoarchaeia archaeon]|nr:TIGR04084 family radical SAM/SPASM domain-containing protein [Candidatus Nanoarchaeia archaeon]MDD5740944.1 TIGR04084 family radical SAM/SPASM domain-containing protein [Candidatus Nanoarchaeia archaeon]
MYYHILLTELCNSECRYCYKKSLEEFDNDLDKKFEFDFSSPAKFEVDIKKLKEFLKKDKDSVLIFYGGEPLLEIEKIKEIIDEINVPFRMQTNGKLLDKIPSSYINKIDKILISIDGDEKRTDFNRGDGAYKKVMDNIKFIKNNGYNGEIIARMTISQDFPDIYEQVLNLINSGFTSVHWQIDAGFYKFDFHEDKIKKFFEDYNKSIKKIIDYWINEMKKGRIIKLYPFLGIVESLLKNKSTKLRCGAGHSGYAITTDGKITSCPIMNCIKDFYVGNIETSNPAELKKIYVSGRCEKCSYLDLCGGRCLYWNKAELWPEKGNDLICKSIIFLIEELKKKIPEIKELINKKIINLSDFEYEKYFGPEIIP